MKKRIGFLFLYVAVMAGSAWAVDIGYYSGVIGHGGMNGEEKSVTENIVQDTTTDVQTTESQNPVIVIDGEPSLPDKPSVSAGSEISYNKTVQTISIPISYGMPVSFFGETRQYLEFHSKIPYTKREVNGVDDSGLGDISVGADYYAMFPSMIVMGSLIAKLPTGEFEDADVPLGSGSTDFGFNVWSGFYMDPVTVKASLGYVLRGEYDDDYGTLTNGNVLNATLGAEYSFNPKVSAGGVLIFKRFEPSEVDGGGVTTDIPGVQTIDLVPKITYMLPMDIDLTATLSIPVTSSWVKGDALDPGYDPERDITFKLHVMYPF